MKDELFGIGRTWLFGALLMILATVLMLFDKIEIGAFQYMITLAFGMAGGKSLVEGFAKHLPKKPSFHEEPETKE